MGIIQALQGKPEAYANIRGNENHEKIAGKASFYSWSNGTIVKVEVMGLPTNSTKNSFFAFHIHEGEKCLPKVGKEPFSEVGGHYSQEEYMHPNHNGDLPMLYANNGYSFMIYYTTRFKPQDIIGKSIIIHAGLDDMQTQPAGNSGIRIACGEIAKANSI